MNTSSSQNIVYTPIASKRKYRVETSYWLDKELKNIFQYEIQINCTGRSESDGWLYEVDKKQVYVNNKIPDLTVDKLAQDCASVLYPLKIAVNPVKYKITVTNNADILKRWKDKKTYLTRYYEGELSKKYLHIHETNIKNPEFVDQAIQNNFFYSIFFHPVHHQCTKKDKEHPIKVPLLPFCPPLHYKATYELQEAEAETVHITQKGTLTDRRTVAEHFAKLPEPLEETTESPLKGSLHAQYNCCSKKGLIHTINGMYDLQMPYGKEIVKINITHLPEKDTPKPKGYTYWEDKKEEKKKHQFFVAEKR